MKRLILIIPTLFLFPFFIFSQGCLPEGVTFTTQEEIDDFPVNYPDCTEIEGSVTIEVDAPISNLDGLGVLNSIGGSFTSRCYTLSDISGLSSLTSVGGDFLIANSQITSFNGLQNLTSVGQDFQIGDFSFIWPGTFNCHGNDLLTSLYGLNNLTNIGGDLRVYCNPLLTNLSSLSNLTTVNEICIGEYADDDCCGNSSLVSLNGLESITALDSTLRISGNHELSDISALSFIDLAGLNFLEIAHNSSLSDCNILSVCNYLNFPGSNSIIHTNGSGCNTLQEVNSSCDTLDCLPEGITFNEQEEVDNFQYDYPGCSAVLGDVVIEGDLVSDLSGLHVLETIGGSFIIQLNNSLFDFTGLENLMSIGGDLKVSHCNGLFYFAGLNGLSHIGGNVDISFNDNLEYVNEMYNLISIGGYLQIINNESLINVIDFNLLFSIGNGLRIEGNDKLENLDGLFYVNGIGNSLEIKDNPNLPNLDGLSNLASVNGSIEIVNNDNLQSINGLSNIYATNLYNLTISYNPLLTECHISSVCDYLTSPNGYINIHSNGTGCNNVVEVADACGTDLDCLPYGNYYLTDQNIIDNFSSKFPACSELKGSVVIHGDGIENLDGLSQISSIEKSLIIRNTDILNNLNGLTNLTSIGRDLAIHLNTSLSDISQLQGLNSIDGEMLIFENNMLESLAGLDNIEAGSIDNLYIFDNALLGSCAVYSICDYIAEPTGEVQIHSNITGCNNEDEVEAACDTLAVFENEIITAYRIIPNPVKSTATIEFSLTHASEVLLQIFNLQGILIEEISTKIIQQGNQQIILNANKLLPGTYFCRLKTDSTSAGQITRLIKL